MRIQMNINIYINCITKLIINWFESMKFILKVLNTNQNVKYVMGFNQLNKNICQEEIIF